MMQRESFSIENWMRQLLEGQMQLTEFNGRFETWWNFEADKSIFKEDVREAIDKLFDAVALYTPYDEDRMHYPGYSTTADVLAKARTAYDLLSER